MPRARSAVAASIFIYDAPRMTKRGRRVIAAWIRAQARYFEHHHTELARTFRARYLYPKNGEHVNPEERHARAAARIRGER